MTRMRPEAVRYEAVKKAGEPTTFRPVGQDPMILTARIPRTLAATWNEWSPVGALADEFRILDNQDGTATIQLRRINDPSKYRDETEG